MEEDLKRQMGEELRKDFEKAEDLFRALCRNTWQKEGEKYSWSDKEAAEIVARVRSESGCPHETYLDYINLDGAGTVAPWLQERLKSLGYTR